MPRELGVGGVHRGGIRSSGRPRSPNLDDRHGHAPRWALSAVPGTEADDTRGRVGIAASWVFVEAGFRALAGRRARSPSVAFGAAAWWGGPVHPAPAPRDCSVGEVGGRH